MVSTALIKKVFKVSLYSTMKWLNFHLLQTVKNIEEIPLLVVRPIIIAISIAMGFFLVVAERGFIRGR